MAVPASCALCNGTSRKSVWTDPAKLELTLECGYCEYIDICGPCVRTAWKDNCKLEDHCKDRRQELYDNWWYWARDFIWLELEQILARQNVASPIWKLKFVRARTLL